VTPKKEKALRDFRLFVEGSAYSNHSTTLRTFLATVINMYQIRTYAVVAFAGEEAENLYSFCQSVLHVQYMYVNAALEATEQLA
jgi:hypothetical protein